MYYHHIEAVMWCSEIYKVRCECEGWCFPGIDMTARCSCLMRSVNSRSQLPDDEDTKGTRV